MSETVATKQRVFEYEIMTNHVVMEFDQYVETGDESRFYIYIHSSESAISVSKVCF